MVAHLKPSASHAAHLHRFTNAALFRVLLNKLYLFIYLFVCLFTFLKNIFHTFSFCSTLMMKKVEKLTGSLIHFSFLTFWVSFCPIWVTICQLVIFYTRNQALRAWILEFETSVHRICEFDPFCRKTDRQTLTKTETRTDIVAKIVV